MTIPEASQLVLTSGAMAKNGEIFVLDMGQPVKILELAENMIRLSGYEPYKDIKIVETGLRPGEKLYEEILINSGSLEKTENKLIFIERNSSITMDFVRDTLIGLDLALKTNDSSIIKDSLMKFIKTYRTPEEVNTESACAEEVEKYMSRVEQYPNLEAKVVSL